MTDETKTRTVKGAATRARIIDAAAQLIAARGLDGVGINDIRQATRTSHGQIFHYFPDGRTELLRNVVVRQTEQALDDQRPELDRLDSWESWRAWGDGLVAVHQQRPTAEGCPLGSLIPQLARSDIETRALLDAGMTRWVTCVQRGLERMVAAGLLGGGVDAHSMARQVVAMVQGGMLIMQASGSIEDLADAVDAVIDHLRRA